MSLNTNISTKTLPNIGFMLVIIKHSLYKNKKLNIKFFDVLYCALVCPILDGSIVWNPAYYL